ncbi:MAG: hypothetical protein ACRDLS_14705 [Solirubrobacteraceae bacterium]
MHRCVYGVGPMRCSSPTPPDDDTGTIVSTPDKAGEQSRTPCSDGGA